MSGVNSLDQFTKYISLGDLVIEDERVEVDPEAMDGLIQSIGALGLLQPIVVVKRQVMRHDQQVLIDTYHVVCGRRRVRAVRALGWNAIPAVIHEMGDVPRKMAVISENLHRQELPKSERDDAMLEFTELYKVLNPDWEQQLRQRRESEFFKSLVPPPAADVVHPFVAGAKAFGVTRQTVKQAVRRAQVLTNQQRKVLDVAGVSETNLNRLCDLDPETINAVVTLVAAGFSFDESIRDTGAMMADMVETQETVDDLLAILPARRTIVDPEAFDADVAVWKKIQPHLDHFKKRIGWLALKATTGKGPHGLCYRRWVLALEMLHPRQWTTCRCQLSGQRDPHTIQNCPICRGGGYQIGR